MTRNSVFDEWKGSVWNEVFLGCPQAPESHCSEDGGLGAYTSIQKTPVIAEKPYISEMNDIYTLNVPKLEIDKVGITEDFKNAD